MSFKLLYTVFADSFQFLSTDLKEFISVLILFSARSLSRFLSSIVLNLERHDRCNFLLYRFNLRISGIDIHSIFFIFAVPFYVASAPNPARGPFLGSRDSFILFTLNNGTQSILFRVFYKLFRKHGPVKVSYKHPYQF